mmetsp:Transcript_99135/g.303096  ORF Transcript_99135/g.303096 Transcript_99135/m.303096 type:complete len:211 (+) Transcript_99135:310-942(+)
MLRGRGGAAPRRSGRPPSPGRGAAAQRRHGLRGVDLRLFRQPTRGDLRLAGRCASEGVGCVRRMGRSAARHGDGPRFPHVRLLRAQGVRRRRCVRNEQVHIDDASIGRTVRTLLAPRGGRHLLRDLPSRVVHCRDRRIELLQGAPAHQVPFVADPRLALRSIGQYRRAGLQGVARRRQGHDLVGHRGHRSVQFAHPVGNLRHARPPQQMG